MSSFPGTIEEIEKFLKDCSDQFMSQARAPAGPEPQPCSPLTAHVDSSQPESTQSQEAPPRRPEVTSECSNMPGMVPTQNSTTNSDTTLEEASDTVPVSQPVESLDQINPAAGSQDTTLGEASDTVPVSQPVESLDQINPAAGSQGTVSDTDRQKTTVTESKVTVSNEGIQMKIPSDTGTKDEIHSKGLGGGEMKTLTNNKAHHGDQPAALRGFHRMAYYGNQNPFEDRTLPYRYRYWGQMTTPNHDHTFYGNQVITFNGGENFYEGQMTIPSGGQTPYQDQMTTFKNGQSLHSYQLMNTVSDHNLYWCDQMTSYDQTFSQSQMTTPSADQTLYQNQMATFSQGQSLHRDQMITHGDHTLYRGQMTTPSGDQTPYQGQMPTFSDSQSLHSGQTLNRNQMMTLANNQTHYGNHSAYPGLMHVSPLGQEQISNSSSLLTGNGQLPGKQKLQTKRHPVEKKSDNLKPYVCTYKDCGKSYSKSFHLRVHHRKHTGEKPYTCDAEGCEWKFSRSDELIRHKRKHNGDRPYNCGKCYRKFARLDNLRQHEKKHHHHPAQEPSSPGGNE